jgi:hypothetical protein
VDASLVLAAMTGITLAAACGLRAFLPLLALGLASRFGVLHLGSSFAWLSSDSGLVALGLATVIEIAADKFPVVDHALDVAGTVLRPAAAAIVALGVLPHLPTPIAALLAIACGAGALGVHALKAKTRLGSTALTLGHLNPLLSLAEDGVTLTLSAAAVLIPIAAFGLLLGVLWLMLRRRSTPSAA